MVSKFISNRFIEKRKQISMYNICENIFITKGSIMRHIILHGKDKSFKQKLSESTEISGLTYMWLLVIAKKKSREKNCNKEQP